MKKHILASIVIPIKDNSDMLKKCLDSISKQNYRPIEVIINDDKKFPSGDNEELAKKFDSRKLKIVYVKKNEGMAQARHSGFLISSGECVLHLDSDMTLGKKVIKECVQKIDPYGGLIIPEKSVASDFWGNCRKLERECYLGDESIECARFYKREAYEKIQYHDDSLVFSEDRDVHIRIKKTGYKIGRINSFIYHHEGKNKLTTQFKKRFYYGTTGERYINKHPLEALIQANIIFRPAFFRNWRLLAKNPHLTIGMFVLRLAEFTAFTAGMIYNRFFSSRRKKL